MKLSLLNDFFGKNISAKQLSETIHLTILDYEKALKVKGGSVTINTAEDLDLFVDKQDVFILCQSYIDGDLTEIEVNYIVDVLCLSEKVSFENKGLFDVIITMTDPGVNGHFTKEVANEILEYCKA